MENLNKTENAGAENQQSVQEQQVAEQKAKAPENIDYKAEWEKSQELLKDKDKSLAKAEYALRHKKNPPADVVDETINTDEELDKPLTKRELNGILRERETSLTRNLGKQSVEAFVRQNTKDEYEAKLALHYYENVLTPSGDVQEDALNAIALANRRRLASHNNEVKLNQESKDNRSVATGAGQKPNQPETEQLSPEAQKILNSPLGRKYPEIGRRLQNKA